MSSSGRGQGRNNSRGGSCRGRGNSNSNRPSNSNSNSREIKFSPAVTGTSGVAYATVKDVILQHIQTNFDGGHDIAKSLRDGQMIDISSSKPSRTISGETEEAARAIQQDGFNIQYELEYKEWMERRNKLKEGMFKAYSLILSEYCNKTMQARIETHPKYESKIQDNAIALLEVIKTLMHNPVRAQYPIASMHEE